MGYFVGTRCFNSVNQLRTTRISGTAAVLEMSAPDSTRPMNRPSGGGILNSGGSAAARIEESTVSRNTHAGVASAGGGGIFNNGGRLEIINSTLSSNMQNSGAPKGGGLYNLGGEVFLLDSTITANRTFSGQTHGLGGGVASSGGFVFVANTIIAANHNDMNRTEATESDCTGTLQSQGFNVLGTPVECDFVKTSDDKIGPFTFFDPVTLVDTPVVLLGPLARNGGLTETHALLPPPRGAVNPAIDNGNPPPTADGFPCEPGDQRILPRAGDCDIGAVELGYSNITNLKEVRQSQMTTRVDPTPPDDTAWIPPRPVPAGPFEGTETIALTVSSTLDPPITACNSFVIVEVSELTGGDLLLEADRFRGRRGVGARKTVTRSGRASSFTVELKIARRTLDKPVNAKFDVLADLCQ
jgi:hypothetical protein